MINLLVNSYYHQIVLLSITIYPHLQFRDFPREGEASVLEPKVPEIRIPPPSSGSVLIFPREISVLAGCLLIVTLLAQRLPIVTIPEELHVSTMRNDMIHDLCTGILTVPLALSTERMCMKESFACLLPPPTITSGSGAAGSGVLLLSFMQRCVLLTILLPVWNQLWTARVRTRMLWSAWHCAISSHEKSPAGIPYPAELLSSSLSSA